MRFILFVLVWFPMLFVRAFLLPAGRSDAQRSVGVMALFMMFVAIAWGVLTFILPK